MLDEGGLLLSSPLYWSWDTVLGEEGAASMAIILGDVEEGETISFPLEENVFPDWRMLLALAVFMMFLFDSFFFVGLSRKKKRFLILGKTDQLEEI